MRPTIKTINLDWLQISGTAEIKIDVNQDFTEKLGGYLLEKIDSKRKNWNNVVKVWKEGIEIAEIFYNPNKTFMDPRKVSVKMNNAVLYEVGVIDLLDDMLQNLGIQYNNVSRMDIAGDGLALLNPFTKCLPGGKYKRVSKSSMTPTFNPDDSIRYVKCGQNQSKRALVGYHKSKELNRSGKYYIKNVWKLNGVQEKDLDNMERLELRLNADYLHVLTDDKIDENGKVLRSTLLFAPGRFQDLYKLQDFDWISRLFVTGLKGMYEFIKRGAKNVTRAKRHFELHNSWTVTKLLGKFKAIATRQINQIKQLSKTLYNCYLHTGAIHYKQLSNELVSVNGLNRWKIKRVRDWEKEYELKKSKNSLGWISNLFAFKDGVQIPLFKTMILEEMKVS